MKALSLMSLPLLAAVGLCACSSPVDSETQAKARSENLAKAVRQPQEGFEDRESSGASASDRADGEREERAGGE